MPAKKPPQRVDGALRLSADANCLDERSTNIIQGRKAQHVTRSARGLDGSITSRTLCPVHFFGRTQLADTITGSLYENDRCLTGALELVAEKAEKKRSKLKRWSEQQVAAGFANGRIRGNVDLPQKEAA